MTNSASPAPRKSFPLFAQLLAGTGSPLHPAGVASSFLSVTTPHPRGCWLGCSRFVTCTSVSWIGALLPCSQPSGHSHFLQKGAEASLGNIPPPQSLKSLAPGVSMRPIAEVLGPLAAFESVSPCSSEPSGQLCAGWGRGHRLGNCGQDLRLLQRERLTLCAAAFSLRPSRYSCILYRICLAHNFPSLGPLSQSTWSETKAVTLSPLAHPLI